MEKEEKKRKELVRNIKITVLEDFRKFKKGDVFDIELQPLGITYLVGSNGIGKSTLLQALRLQGDKLASVNKDRADGIRPHTFDMIEKDVLPKLQIEGFDFDEVYALDAVADDPLAMENSITAGSFVMGGGMMLQKASKGEKSIFMLDRFKKDIIKCIDTSDKSFMDKNRLFILDEIDEGLDLKFQVKFNQILENMLCLGFFGSVLVVSHNVLCMLSECPFGIKVYDLDNKRMADAHEYIKYKTDGEYDIQIEKLKSDADTLIEKLKTEKEEVIEE